MTDFIIKKLVHGVGRNDADYTQRITEELPRLDGKRNQKIIWICPFYRRWVEMIRRCYSETSLTKNPTYIGCSVCEEWLTFSNFKSWMETQDWEGKQLDKDLLVYKNKVYSPNTCCFIPTKINTFLISPNKHSGSYMLGVYFSHSRGMYVAQCRTGDGKNKNLGGYSVELDAHRAWQEFKYGMTMDYSKEAIDCRVKEGLLRVAAKIKYDYDNNLITEDF